MPTTLAELTKQEYTRELATMALSPRIFLRLTMYHQLGEVPVYKVWYRKGVIFESPDLALALDNFNNYFLL